MMWLRHTGDSKFHTGAPRDGSYHTLCDGRWPLTDVARGAVECSDNPPTVDRCELCVKRHAASEAERTGVVAGICVGCGGRVIQRGRELVCTRCGQVCR